MFLSILYSSSRAVRSHLTEIYTPPLRLLSDIVPTHDGDSNIDGQHTPCDSLI